MLNHPKRASLLLLLLSDFIIIFFSVYLALYLRFNIVEWQPVSEALPDYPIQALVFTVAMLIGLLTMGLYQSQSPQGTYFYPFILVKTIIGLVIGSLILLVVYYIFPMILMGRGLFAYALIYSTIILSIFRTYLYHLLDGRILRKKILVLGAGELAANLTGAINDDYHEQKEVKKILAPSSASYIIHGFINIDSEERVVPEKYIVNIGASLVDYCHEYEIDEIVLAMDDRRNIMPVDSLLDCKLSGIRVSEFLSFWEKEEGMLRLDKLNPSWFIFCEGCEQGSLEKAITRIFDLFTSFVILVLTFPILILTAMLIFLENSFKGPIFYRQKRVGLNGRIFQLLKFRSMIENAESDGEAKWAAENDMRVTIVGKFIRKYRIDEIPQVINIFKGDMSLVGPRPERPEFVASLEKQIPFFTTRHRVKPGLAGWAQLKYPYGANEEDAYNKLQYDLFYLKNHSIFMDILILLQTVEVILLGKGAR